MDEEKRRHAETIKILRKKERQVKEIMVQVEEDQTQIQALSDSLDKVNQKVNIYKRQLQEQVCWEMISILSRSLGQIMKLIRGVLLLWAETLKFTYFKLGWEKWDDVILFSNVPS